ncbi:MAG: hypothetical protein HY751_12830 [Nitrospinae bacterium]|nr:hypothetical protein [Nitrospinota bacterium]
MKSLPIRGMGLDAVIKDTLADPPAPQPDPEVTARLKAALEKESSALAETQELLRLRNAALLEMDGEKARLASERDRLEKELAEWVPGGAGRELLLAALKERAETFGRAGNLLDAFHLYRRALRLNPLDTGLLYEIATIYYSAGLYHPSAECLRAIVELAPGHERAAENLKALEEELRES